MPDKHKNDISYNTQILIFESSESNSILYDKVYQFLKEQDAIDLFSYLQSMYIHTITIDAAF